MENKKPNYFSILTADVRYDKRLSSTEKLLFSEITALTNKEGICWAKNSYFADLYGLTPNWVSKTIQKLKKLGYIETEVIYKPNSRQVLRRNIYLSNKTTRGIVEKYGRGIVENYKENNINKNNIKRIYRLKDFNGNVVKDDLDSLYDN